MKILIKGAGDIASGVACRLYNCGIQIIMTELPIPTAVRRTVSFSRAIYEESAEVEGITARRCDTPQAVAAALEDREIPIIPVSNAEPCMPWQPDAVVDAILAKRNTGTAITDASVVIGLGPGFTVGTDCHCVIETMRGHDLGRCIYSGSATENTGIPGSIGGYSSERLLRAPCSGVFTPAVQIGDLVEKGSICATVNGVPLFSRIHGVVRGLLQRGVIVTAGMKAGDIDPRSEREYCFSVSDKARSIGGGVLEALLTLNKRLKE